MISRDPKKMASGVLARAFGGEISSGKKGNYKAPSAGREGSFSIGSNSGANGNYSRPEKREEESYSFFGNPGSDSNYDEPDEEVQGYAEGGEVDEGKQMAAEELLSALDSKDPKALAQALESFVAQCQDASMDMDEQE